MSPVLNLHVAERHFDDLLINLGAAVYVWWRFRRPTILRRAGR